MSFRLGAGSEGAVENDSLMLAGIVFGVCALASAAMIGYTTIKGISLENQKEDYNERITELYPAKQIYENCNAAYAELTSCKAMYNLTKNQMERSLPLIEELESNMPSDFMLTSMTLGTDGVTMSVVVGSKESFADVLLQLRECENVASLSCGSFSENTAENGEVKITATIKCTFAALTE